jgi:hypothetical protein
MDRGIWAIWYELPEDARLRTEYLSWFHQVHVAEKLARPGYLWAAHYELGHGGDRFQAVVDRLVHASDAGLGRGRGYLALFGGTSAHTFMDPSPAQLAERQSPETRRMIGLRRETYACIFAEEARVDGPEVKCRAPGITPGAYIQMGSFNVTSYTMENEVGAWYAQHRLPFMASMPGCIRARKLLAAAGWGKHSVLCEIHFAGSARRAFRAARGKGARSRVVDRAHPAAAPARTLLPGRRAADLAEDRLMPARAARCPI